MNPKNKDQSKSSTSKQNSTNTGKYVFVQTNSTTSSCCEKGKKEISSTFKNEEDIDSKCEWMDDFLKKDLDKQLHNYIKGTQEDGATMSQEKLSHEKKCNIKENTENSLTYRDVLDNIHELLELSVSNIELIDRALCSLERNNKSQAENGKDYQPSLNYQVKLKMQSMTKGETESDNRKTNCFNKETSDTFYNKLKVEEFAALTAAHEENDTLIERTTNGIDVANETDTEQFGDKTCQHQDKLFEEFFGNLDANSINKLLEKYLQTFPCSVKQRFQGHCPNCYLCEIEAVYASSKLIIPDFCNIASAPAGPGQEKAIETEVENSIDQVNSTKLSPILAASGRTVEQKNTASQITHQSTPSINALDSALLLTNSGKVDIQFAQSNSEISALSETLDINNPSTSGINRPTNSANANALTASSTKVQDPKSSNYFHYWIHLNHLFNCNADTCDSYKITYNHLLKMGKINDRGIIIITPANRQVVTYYDGLSLLFCHRLLSKACLICINFLRHLMCIKCFCECNSHIDMSHVIKYTKSFIQHTPIKGKWIVQNTTAVIDQLHCTLPNNFIRVILMCLRVTSSPTDVRKEDGATTCQETFLKCPKELKEVLTVATSRNLSFCIASLAKATPADERQFVESQKYRNILDDLIKISKSNIEQNADSQLHSLERKDKSETENDVDSVKLIHVTRTGEAESKITDHKKKYSFNNGTKDTSYNKSKDKNVYEINAKNITSIDPIVNNVVENDIDNDQFCIKTFEHIDYITAATATLFEQFSNDSDTNSTNKIGKYLPTFPSLMEQRCQGHHPNCHWCKMETLYTSLELKYRGLVIPNICKLEHAPAKPRQQEEATETAVKNVKFQKICPCKGKLTSKQIRSLKSNKNRKDNSSSTNKKTDEQTTKRVDQTDEVTLTLIHFNGLKNIMDINLVHLDNRDNRFIKPSWILQTLQRRAQPFYKRNVVPDAEERILMARYNENWEAQFCKRMNQAFLPTKNSTKTKSLSPPAWFESDEFYQLSEEHPLTFE